MKTCLECENCIVTPALNTGTVIVQCSDEYWTYDEPYDRADFVKRTIRRAEDCEDYTEAEEG